ncbi:MAG TPA: formate dehydrogenase accessory sulfurtransferase FdhD [Verrucomicrobiales bacterium]|nr:formate dehydrogenase accessory sulfurtransferase FdhD [Verrucomicrobiales bacterium]
MPAAASTTQLKLVRIKDGRRRRVSDALVVEEPLEIRVNGRPLTLTMRTPGHDHELAAGFLFAEGLVASADGIARCAVNPRNREGNVLDVTLASETEVDWSRLQQRFAGTSSCGLCGRESIAAIRRRIPRIRSRAAVPAAVLERLPGRLLQSQEAFALTGGLHAAGLFDLRGRLLVAREDVGRHNAVDKVLGWALLAARLPLDRHVLMVSGRASFEIVQKSQAASLPVVCAVSAPSSLAVKLAAAGGQTLVGYLREGRMNIYSRPRRVTSR